ncbi:deoxyribonuclease-1-like [Mastacembelus armatus]|uniref:deoxyribonuclease-1-like n=1 Tax=Mastacembelus armatus TaxID=205130 RepID=UPI000E45CA7C|nr:deoxyribonuclease-1-like [Mastacembelus armatus]
MKIAAFNVKKLGMEKVKKKTVMRHLTKIMSQYTVVVILEVVDKTGKAMEKLLQELNNTGNNRTHPYDMIRSRQLGRDIYKEQFVFFWRRDEVTQTDCYQYEDNQVGDEDAFAREPFVLRFSCPTTVVEDLVLIPVHTKPQDAQKELDELHDVVNRVRKKWRTDNIMLLGDFNADGHYLSKKKKDKIRICSAPYYWLIDDSVDTTSSNNNDNTYDRIVVYGETMRDAVVPGSAKPFNFQTEFGLTDKQALSVSDHYPVEVELQTVQTVSGPQKKKPGKQKRGQSSDVTDAPAKRRKVAK